jgi:hypothetical protein
LASDAGGIVGPSNLFLLFRLFPFLGGIDSRGGGDRDLERDEEGKKKNEKEEEEESI